MYNLLYPHQTHKNKREYNSDRRRKQILFRKDINFPSFHKREYNSDRRRKPDDVIFTGTIQEIDKREYNSDRRRKHV